MTLPTIRKPERPAKKPPPYLRADYDTPDVSALQALLRGEANPEQQKRALDWIIKSGAMTYNVTFQPESDRASSFAEGRRFVGLEIVKLLSLSVRDLLQKQPT